MFFASHVSESEHSSIDEILTHDTSEVKVYDSSFFNGCENEEERESENEEEVNVSELQNVFQELYKESIKLKRANLKLEASLRESVKVIDENTLIEDLRTCERTLQEKLEYVEGERDSLKGLMESLEKELLVFEERNVLLESTLLQIFSKFLEIILMLVRYSVKFMKWINLENPSITRPSPILSGIRPLCILRSIISIRWWDGCLKIYVCF